MNLERMKLSLIHIRDRTIHKGIIVLTRDCPNCALLFTSSVTQDIKVKGHDYFQCLINLRIELEKLNYYPLCNGARKNISCGGMLREASEGRLAYLVRLEEYCHLDEDIEVFDYAEPDLVVSVSEQEAFKELHLKSLPEIIGYSTESTGYGAELISPQAQEKIIDRLSSSSDWQLLRREGNRLLFKFLNTPEKPRWNIDMTFERTAIDVLFTIGNDTKREAFLTFLNEQLTSNGIVCKFQKF